MTSRIEIEQQPTTSTLPAGLSRFDGVVLLIMLALLALVALIIWRGDHVGLGVAATQPAAGSTAVSVQTNLSVTFRQDVTNQEALTFQVSPPLSGTVRWEGRRAMFVPAGPLQPDTTYTVSIAPGLQSRQGRALLRPLEWQFTTGHPRLLYLTWDETSRNQLFLIDPAGGEPQQLTEAPLGLMDFSPSPDGRQIVYSAAREDGGADLYRLFTDRPREATMLLDCASAVCTGPVWSPAGQRLVYERRTLTQPNAPPGPPRLWWLDVNSGETVPVFEDSQWLGLGARFSADGAWISYISPQSQEIHAYNLTTGQTVLIPSQTGEPPAWSPDGRTLLVSEIQFQGEQFSVHIFKADVATAELTKLTDELAVNDGSPIWSPDGEWILFARKVARAPMGKQLWLIRPDGSETIQLTDETEIHNGLPSWSPDGRQILVQRYHIAAAGADPGMWVLDLATRELREIVTPAIQPAWLP